MARKLELRLLGTPEVTLDGEPLRDLKLKKAQAILYFLAVTGRPQMRSVLAGLLWGDVPETSANTNLRKALAALRLSLGAFLDIDNETVALKPGDAIRVDVAELEAWAAGADAPTLAQLELAIELYRGDFLQGFYVREAPDFERWVEGERVRLRELALGALQALAAHHAAGGDLASAIEYTRRLLALEPWREEAQRDLMRLLARAGQRAAALAQFETCRHALRDELDVDPAPATIALYERIRAGEWEREGIGGRENGENRDRSGTHTSTPPLPHSPTPHLPSPATPFVGRRQELDEVLRLLKDPACRLLTLVGPGGAGKSRLALQVAHTLAATGGDQPPAGRHFGDGVLFIPLAAVTTADGIAAAIAETAGFNFYRDVPGRQQLLDRLRDQAMLLVLDNFEHLSG